MQSLIQYQTSTDKLIDHVGSFLGEHLPEDAEGTRTLLRLSAVLQFCYPNPNRLGLFAVESEQHWQIWDEYLAEQAEKASLIRGLASQHLFFVDPDRELETNAAYCCGIAWAVLDRAGMGQVKTITEGQVLQAWRTLHPDCSDSECFNVLRLYRQLASKVEIAAA